MAVAAAVSAVVAEAVVAAAAVVVVVSVVEINQTRMNEKNEKLALILLSSYCAVIWLRFVPLLTVLTNESGWAKESLEIVSSLRGD